MTDPRTIGVSHAGHVTLSDAERIRRDVIAECWRAVNALAHLCPADKGVRAACRVIEMLGNKKS